MPTSLLSDPQLSNRIWRLSCGKIYFIKNASGQKVPFIPNEAQLHLLQNLWYKNLILKARQLGFTTLIELILLDSCLFEKNILAGVLAQDMQNARLIFREKIKFAFDNLPQEIKGAFGVKSNSTSELAFSNGSRIRVGTSFRGGTYQYLHISEFGKICAANPQKAREIITGALWAIDSRQYVFIESSAEGEEGYFFDMCQKSQFLAENSKKLSSEEYRFFFFPWYKEPRYALKNPYTNEKSEYFAELENRGIVLSDEQKAWWVKKEMLLGDDIFREYPSSPQEAFLKSTRGAYYERDLLALKIRNGLQNNLYNPKLPVSTAWDLGGAGGGDSTAIWFFQQEEGQIFVIEYLESSGYSMEEYIDILASRPYRYARHIAPHDIRVHEYSSGKTRWESARAKGVTFFIAPRLSISDGIESVRKLLRFCIFDPQKTALGLRALGNYRRKYEESTGSFLDSPLHNEYSHGADAFRALALGLRDELPLTNIESSISLDPFFVEQNTFL